MMGEAMSGCGVGGRYGVGGRRGGGKRGVARRDLRRMEGRRGGMRGGAFWLELMGRGGGALRAWAL